MKKLLAAALVTGILFFMPVAEAEIKIYTGTDEYTVGERETQEAAQDNSRKRALRNAQEQAGLFIRSESRTKDLELVEDEIVTLAAGIVRVVGAPQYRKEILSDGKSVLLHTTVTVQIDTDELQREIERLRDDRRPKPPVDRPKPIDQPKPVEQPKPKVEQPKPKVESPQPTVVPPVKPPSVEKIEPPTPVEPVTPAATFKTDDQNLASELMDAINAERAKAGKSPLTRNSVLAQGARTRAEELTRQWSHKRPNGQNWSTVLPASFQSKTLWEYIHSKYDSPQKIVSWYISQPDKKILSSDYKEIGIGYVYNPSSAEKHFWVVILR